MKAGLFRRRRLRACPGGSPSAPETSLRWGVARGWRRFLGRVLAHPDAGGWLSGPVGPPAGLKVLMAQAGLSMEKNLLKRKMQATRPAR